MSWIEFKRELLEEVTAKIWAQWSALGVRSTEGSKAVAVDLEALLLGTWSFGRTDPRLFDEALSWCCQFGDLVNTRRLEKLLDEAADPMLNRVAAAWAVVIAKIGDASWKLRIDTPDGANSRGLFLSDELQARSTGPKRDSIFEQQGLIRGPFQFRDHAPPPDFTDLRLAQLFARKLMGGGCRSEVFGQLLLGVDATTAELADMAVYSRRSVQDVLGDLKTAGLLDWESGRGRTTRASLQKRALHNFASLITHDERPGDAKAIIEHRDWPGFFLGLVELWRVATRIERSGFQGFKAQMLLSEALPRAAKYHRRTTERAVYNPTVAAESMDELMGEARIYLESLWDVERFADAGGQVPNPL